MGICGRFLANTLVPPTCLICDRLVEREGGCCAACWNELHFIAPPFCPVMGTPFVFDPGSGLLSAEAIATPPPFEKLRAALVYNQQARRLVSLLKYSDRTDLAPWMARWMYDAANTLIGDCDVVVPVPLHRTRIVSRRFNQSAELARHIASVSGVKFAPEYLVRHKRTTQQVGLSRNQREQNLAGAFVVPEEHRADVNSARILLIDDVYTTGATVRAATRSLKRAGAHTVLVLVFAKVDHHLSQ